MWTSKSIDKFGKQSKGANIEFEKQQNERYALMENNMYTRIFILCSILNAIEIFQ